MPGKKASKVKDNEELELEDMLFGDVDEEEPESRPSPRQMKRGYPEDDSDEDLVDLEEDMEGSEPDEVMLKRANLSSDLSSLSLTLGPDCCRMTINRQRENLHGRIQTMRRSQCGLTLVVRKSFAKQVRNPSFPPKKLTNGRFLMSTYCENYRCGRGA